VKGTKDDYCIETAENWQFQRSLMACDGIFDVSIAEEHIFVGNCTAKCEAIILDKALEPVIDVVHSSDPDLNNAQEVSGTISFKDIVRVKECGLASDTSLITVRGKVRPVCDFHAVKRMVFFFSLFLQFSGVSAAGTESADLLDSFVKIAYILLLVLLARVLWKFGTGLEIIMQNLTICISGFSEFVAFKRQWWCLDMLPAIISAGAIFANTWFMNSNNPFQFVKQGYFADKVKDGASLTAILIGTLMFATVPVFGFKFASGKFKSWLSVLKESSYIAWFVHIIEHWCETGDIKIPDDPHHVGSKEWKEFTKASGFAWGNGDIATDKDIEKAKEQHELSKSKVVKIENPYAKIRSKQDADDIIAKVQAESGDEVQKLSDYLSSSSGSSSDDEISKIYAGKKEIMATIDDSTGLAGNDEIRYFSNVCDCVPAIEAHACRNYKDVLKGYAQVVKVYNYCYSSFADMNKEFYAKVSFGPFSEEYKPVLQKQGYLLNEFFNVLFDSYGDSYLAKEIMRTDPELLGNVLVDLHSITVEKSKELGETIVLIRKLKTVRTSFLALLPPMPVESVEAPSMKMTGGLGSKMQKQYKTMVSSIQNLKPTVLNSSPVQFVRGEVIPGIVTTVKEGFDMTPFKRKAQYAYCWLINKYADWQLSDKEVIKPEEKQEECVRVFKKFSFTAFLWTAVTTVVILGVALGAAVVSAREKYHEDCEENIPNVPKVHEKGTRQVSGKDYVKKMYTRDATADVPKQLYETSLYDNSEEEQDFEDSSGPVSKGARSKRRGKAIYAKTKQAITFKLGESQFDIPKDDLIGYLEKHKEVRTELQSIIADPPIKINPAVERTFSVYFKIPSGERYYLMNAHLVANKFISCAHMFDMHEELKNNFAGVEPDYIVGKDGNEWIFKKSQFVNFVTADDLGYFPANTGFSMDKVHPRVPKDGEVCLLVARDADLGHGEVPNLSSGICSKEGFYTCSSAAGFCGAPVIASSDGNLLGFHQAGSKIGNFFCPFTKELLEEVKAPLMPRPRHF